MISIWYLFASSFLGCVAVVAAIWIFAKALSKRPFWIVCYHHKHGITSWPVFCKSQPDLEYLLKTDKNFAGDWEGEGGLTDEQRHEFDGSRESEEYVDFSGPWYVGTYPFLKP